MNVLIGSIYRPPNTDEKMFNKSLLSILKFAKSYKGEVIIGSDYNLDLLKSDRHKQTQYMLVNILANEMLPCITHPTRITKSSATLIDNITTSRNIFNTLKCGIAICDLSDHFPCIMAWPNAVINKKDTYSFTSKKLNDNSIANIKRDLSIDWTATLEKNLSINDKFQLFHDKLQTTIDNNTEEKEINFIYKCVIREPWITKGIVKANKKQLSLYKNWLMNKSAKNYDSYKQYCDTLRKIKINCKNEYYVLQCEQYKQNSKQLWKLINDVCGKNNDKSNSMSHITVNGINTYQSSVICNEFADFFSSIGSKLANKTAQSDTNINTYLNKIQRNPKSIFLTPCTRSKIRRIIINLKAKKSFGDDGISNLLLKEVCDTILDPLTIIFNESLTIGVFPEIMKLAEIVPLFKKGNPHHVDNYRPISLLITISKILEKLLYTRVYNFLDSTTQIYASQYGFRKCHSCEHAVQELVGNILKGKERHEHSIGIFLDLLKAFDMLEHDMLLKKLEIYGIRGTAFDWFKSYLSNRKMRVRCNVNGINDTSTNYHVNYGVPQGSCLGPLLFLVFCNDLHLNLEFTKCILFADNTTIYNSHKDLRYLAWTLEHDLSIVSDWFKANKLTLNTSKSVCILFKANN